MSKNIRRKIKSLLAVSLCCAITLQNVMIIGNAEQADLSVENQMNIDSTNSQVEENLQESVVEDEENLDNDDTIVKEEESTEDIEEDITEESTEEKIIEVEQVDPGRLNMGATSYASYALPNLDIVELTNPNAIGSGTIKDANSLNVRSGPSTAYEVIGTLKRDESIEILGTSNGWYKIELNGKDGYISPTYITLNPLDKGIDVSKWNGNIDWKKVKQSGISYAIIRGGFGTSTVDPYFHANMKGALDAGVKVGVYWFSYATSIESARQEAQKCLEVLAPYRGRVSYPVFYDYEYDSVNYADKQGITITKDLSTDMAKMFIQTIKSQGYVSGIYTNRDFSSKYFHDDVLFSNNVWSAQYNSVNTFNKPYSMWQYTDKGVVPGIAGGVDLNYTTLKTFDIGKPVDPDPIPPTDKRGWQLEGGKWYYYDNNGHKVKGWLQLNGIYYYLKDNGEMATGWLQLNGTYYYLKPNGEMATGWLQLDGIYYYLREGGQMSTGWINLDGTYYYLREGGQMATGWIQLNGTYYYLREGGQMSTGWIELNGIYYYLRESGAMATGWLQLNGTWYYLRENGAMAVNTVIDGWSINENGVATPLG